MPRQLRWLQPDQYPMLDGLEAGEAELVIQNAWSLAWRRPLWRSPLAVKTIAIGIFQLGLLIAAIILLPWHFVLLFIGAEFLLSLLFGNLVRRVLYKRDMTRCIEAVLAARGHARCNGNEAETTWPDDVQTKFVKRLVPAVRALPPPEVFRVVNAASGCMGLKQRIPPKKAWFIIVVSVGGMMSILIVNRLIRDSVSLEIRTVLGFVAFSLLFVVGMVFHLRELNSHAERIIADEAAGVEPEGCGDAES